MRRLPCRSRCRSCVPVAARAETIRDLTSHPWAGAKVRLTLVARDEAGQEGFSKPVEMTLPAKTFIDLLAKAVIEQRGGLALDANAVPRVSEALDALTFAPDKTIPRSGTYLPMTSAYHRIGNAHSDDDLRDVVDYLWAIALGIEDGDLSLAAEDLRAAEDALRQALENGATDEQIRQLTEQLRQAMDRYLQAMMNQMQRQPQQNQQAQQFNQQALQQMLNSQNLQQMLDQLQNLAQTGARDAARQLLSQLQQMLENLQQGQQQFGQQMDSQMMQMLSQLGELIQKQQELMDQTYRAQRGLGPAAAAADRGSSNRGSRASSSRASKGSRVCRSWASRDSRANRASKATGPAGPAAPGGQQAGNQPLTKEQLQQLLQQLQQQQQALQQSLQSLMQQLEGMGMQPGGQFGQAGQAMGQATGNLGRGQPGSAVTNQGEALDALRQGAQAMVQALAQNGQRGPGQGQRGPGQGNQLSQQDPLGRPQRDVGADIGSTVKVPDEIDTQRAREILDAIRQRLGELYRPEQEREYLDRLLQQQY